MLVRSSLSTNVSDLFSITLSRVSLSTTISKDSAGTILWPIIFVRSSIISISLTTTFTLRTNSFWMLQKFQGQELVDASDDELVEVQEPAIEVLEQCEFEEDVGLEEIDQDKLEVVETACIDLMLLGKISTFVKD